MKERYGRFSTSCKAFYTTPTGAAFSSQFYRLRSAPEPVRVAQCQLPCGPTDIDGPVLLGHLPCTRHQEEGPRRRIYTIQRGKRTIRLSSGRQIVRGFPARHMPTLRYAVLPDESWRSYYTIIESTQQNISQTVEEEAVRESTRRGRSNHRIVEKYFFSSETLPSWVLLHHTLNTHTAVMYLPE